MSEQTETQPMPPATCGTCRFLRPYPSGVDGMCHRFPPISAEFSQRWPYVINHEWCGEFQPAGVAKAERDALREMAGWEEVDYEQHAKIMQDDESEGRGT